MFSGQRLHPWGATAVSWNGEILSLPSASTRAGLVLISEKQPSTPWCARTVSMKNVLASLTTLRSHLQTSPEINPKRQMLQRKSRTHGGHGAAHPNAAAVLIAEMTCASRGALMRQSRMSSAVFPRACSSAIILSWRKWRGKAARAAGVIHSSARSRRGLPGWGDASRALP